MSSRSRAAHSVWRARTSRAPGDRVFMMYMAFMLAVVTVIPAGRAVWLSAASPAGLALLADAAAPRVVSLAVAALWAGALTLGQDRGPVVLPPFLTYSLASSDLPRADAFRTPLLQVGTTATAVGALVAALISISLAVNGLTSPVTAAAFIAVGALVGATVTAAWLIGQVFPRAARLSAVSIVGVAALTVVVPALWDVTPWGWVGLAYPTRAISVGILGLAVAAAILIALMPAMLNRLSFTALTAHSARWDAATAHSSVMDFSAATSVYQRQPHLGRRLRAVLPKSNLGWTFFVRDAIGAARTPGRLIVGVLAVAAAGLLLALAFTPIASSWLFGAAAGIFAFAGIGPLTDGVRHAASVAADASIYGITDGRLLVNHSRFPLTVAVTILLMTVIVCSIVIGSPIVPALISAPVLGLLVLTARVNNALKTSLPTFLFAPMSTPVGDPMQIVRAAWALEAVLLSALAGAAAAFIPVAPILLIGVAAALAAIGIKRWRDRR